MTCFGRQPALLSAAFAVVVMAAGPASADVKVHGATTVTFGLMRPHKEAIEKTAGVELTILPSSTSRGLTDLAQGKADIAMLAEPLESAAESINKKQPGIVKPRNSSASTWAMPTSSSSSIPAIR